MRIERVSLARLRTVRRMMARMLRSDSFDCLRSANEHVARNTSSTIEDSIYRLDRTIANYANATALERSQALSFAMGDRRWFFYQAERLGCVVS